MFNVTFQQITNDSHAKQAETIQRQAWNCTDREIVPARFMLELVNDNCGLLLGAIEGNKLTGFTFGTYGIFPNIPIHNGPLKISNIYLNSLILGVLPNFQNQGLGYKLKLFQRKHALEMGIRQISWVYDPLESRNAWLNIGKLGATSRVYLRNYQGELSGINSNLETDRFNVQWEIDSERVQKRILSGPSSDEIGDLLKRGAKLANKATYQRGLLVPSNQFNEITAPLLIAEIPSNFQNIKEKDLMLATSWREHTRQLFENLFKKGFYIKDFIRAFDTHGQARSYYVLSSSSA